jgi:predicted acyltransferase
MNTDRHASAERLEAIDHFRGFAIVTMVLANYLAGIRWIPNWLKHAPDIGLTVIDLVAPFFIFAIGLTYNLSFQRRLNRFGPKATYQHFFTRFMALVGLGAIFSTGEIWFGQNPGGVNWGVLQAIGVAGLITLPLLKIPTTWRVTAGLVLLGGYQLLLDRFWLSTVLHSPHGGLGGSLGWAAMMILATGLADLYHNQPKGRKAYFWAALLTLVFGAALMIWVPVSKNRVSASYVLISMGASSVLFAVLHWIVEQRHLTLPLLAMWGQNSLVLYTLHSLLLGLMVLPGNPGWYAEAPAWLVGIQILGLLGIMSLVSWYLHRKGFVFAL